jgi:hypothetical protein
MVTPQFEGFDVGLLKFGEHALEREGLKDDALDVDVVVTGRV